MTQEDIIRMAREAGYYIRKFDGEDEVMEGDNYHIQTDLIGRFAGLVAAAEREECAKLCDSLEEQCEKLLVPDEKWPTPVDCAFVIRARGVK